jgi:hypothetical protein
MLSDCFTTPGIPLGVWHRNGETNSLVNENARQADILDEHLKIW